MVDSLAAPGAAPGAIAAPTGWGVLLRRVLALAAPTTLVAVIQSLCQLVEPVLAARQGTAALAGWAVVLPFALLLQQMSTGAMGGGVVSAIARALGAGRREEASALVLHAVVIALGFGLVFSVVLAGFPHAILGLIGGPDAAAGAAAYCAWLFGAGAIPAWLANTLASVLRGGGRHALASRVLLLAWIGYPPLAWALMEPAGLGLAGAGIAFAVMMTAATVGMAVVVLRGGAGFVPTLRVRLQAALFRRILSVGLIACVMATIANLTTILVTAAIARHGAAAVAAYGVSARLEFLMVPLAFGVGSALTALVGRAVGAGDWGTARRIAWTGGLLALGSPPVSGWSSRSSRRPPLRSLPATPQSPASLRGRSPSSARPCRGSVSAWRCTSPPWAPAGCAGRRWQPAPESPSRLAVAGCCRTGSAGGWRGNSWPSPSASPPMG
ncbi:MATE family efflux transporter [Siccirubricoccus deserti]